MNIKGVIFDFNGTMFYDGKIPFTIATASGLNNVKFFFKYLNLANWFDIGNVVYDDGTIPGKPEPEIYMRAAPFLSTVSMLQWTLSSSGFTSIKSLFQAMKHNIISKRWNKHHDAN